MSATLKLNPVTDAAGFIAYREDLRGPGAMSPLTFVSNKRGYDILDAIRDCEKDIRTAAPNCQIAAHIGAIGDQLKTMLDANEAEPA